MRMRFLCLAVAVAASLAGRADFEVYFMRHGETSWNRAKVLQGSIAELKRRGAWVSLWCVQDSQKAAKYGNSGCDAFVTDCVSRVR